MENQGMSGIDWGIFTVCVAVMVACSLGILIHLISNIFDKIKK